MMLNAFVIHRPIDIVSAHCKHPRSRVHRLGLDGWMDVCVRCKKKKKLDVVLRIRNVEKKPKAYLTKSQMKITH